VDLVSAQLFKNSYHMEKLKRDRYCLSQSKQGKENVKDEEKTASWLEEKKEKKSRKKKLTE
jgi:hypothetical protein